MGFLRFNSLALGLVGALLTLLPNGVQSQDFKASLANMPMSAERDKNGRLHGAYVELIKGLDQVSNSETKIYVEPFKRSVRNLTKGLVDYHIPLIKIPGIDPTTLPYAFSTSTLFQVAFVLYTNVNKPLDRSRLGDYTILTDTAHTDFFPFKVSGVTCLPCAIRTLNAGRIDGFIFAQNEIDPYILKYKLGNIHRQLYHNFDVKVLIPRGEAGQSVDRYLSAGIGKLRANGAYDKLLAPVLAPYKDWQPSELEALQN
jgi:polar amino acid transport system substrate-binding protein